jgi:hypothetical protein
MDRLSFSEIIRATRESRPAASDAEILIRAGRILRNYRPDGATRYIPETEAYAMAQAGYRPGRLARQLAE